MKKSFKTLIQCLILGFIPHISFSQINYSLSTELGQAFANFEKKETIQKDFREFGDPELRIRPQFSPNIGLTHTISFGEDRNIGTILKMQLERIHFTRQATFIFENPDYTEGIENRYQLNRVNLPVEFFFKVGKVKFSAGIINTWNIGGKIITARNNNWNISTNHITYEIGKNRSHIPEAYPGWSISTSLNKKYSLQSTFGFDFPLNNRWQFGASYRHSMTQSVVRVDIFDYDIFYSLEFQNQVNSLLVSLSYLLIK